MKAFAEIADRGWALVEGFAEPALFRALRAEIEAARANGAMHAAGTGHASAFALRTELRNDWIQWLEPGALSPAQSEVWRRLDELRVSFNRELLLGLRWLEAHVAVYPEGAFYKKHRDRFHGTESRRLSCILYLNDDWEEADGGTLRIYRREDGETLEREISPVGGNLVLFLSDEIAHEVLTTRRARYSLTGWFRNDDPR